jgi:hypothetical protein
MELRENSVNSQMRFKEDNWWCIPAMIDLHCPKCGAKLNSKPQFGMHSHHNIPPGLFDNHAAFRCDGCLVHYFYALLRNGELYNYQGSDVEWILVRQKKKRVCIPSKIIGGAFVQ